MILDKKTIRSIIGMTVVLSLSTIYIFYFTDADVSWTSLLLVGLFYIGIIGFGIYAAARKSDSDVNEVLLAGRKIPLSLAIFTMSATWIGGGFINGTAEYTFDSGYGLIWVQAPWGYAMSLIIGGLFFARKMRDAGYKTMLDPLEEKFGKQMASVLFLPALSGEIFWSAAILTALGTTFGIILGIDLQAAIVISAFIAIAYTAIGGLWAVAITDMLQLVLLFVGLILVLPFAVDHLGGFNNTWILYKEKMGALATLLPSKSALGDYYWQWWDYALLLMFGGIPWQVYFQRVLSAKDGNTAVKLSLIAGFVCILAAIPASMIGMIGTVTDWAALGLPIPNSSSSILPHVMRHLTPPLIGAIGLGAIAAAVMSSVDSSILSAASMTSWNVYRPLIKPDISPSNLAKVLKRCIWIIGAAATVLALNIESVYELWFLCSDFVYCLLFPALVCALFDPKANVYGAASGFAVAAFLRFGGGDSTLGIPPFIEYPMMVDGNVLFPFRTLAMVCGLLTIIIVSRLWTHKTIDNWCC
ncbi:MAG: sodium:solute symporter family protein [Saprospiraceae bacterium]